MKIEKRMKLIELGSLQGVPSLVFCDPESEEEPFTVVCSEDETRAAAPLLYKTVRFTIEAA
jgi:hypothetical protein